MIDIRLVTIQPVEILSELIKNQYYICNPVKTEVLEDSCFRNAYEWMTKQMAEFVGPAPCGVKYPIWAWYRHDDDYGYWNHDGKVYAKITLEVDDERVLLSDFDDWHCVLNNCPVEEDDEEGEYATEAEVRATWKRIFHADGETVQATFWELYADDVLNIEIFTSTKEESE